MTSDEKRWDLRHAAERGAPVRAPDAFVAEVLGRLGPGAGRPALDLACGTGRHALRLAELGWDAHGWDLSPVGLDELARRAAERGLRVGTRVVDVATCLPEDRDWALVVVVDFLDRSLFGRLRHLVREGGDVVLTTFTEDWPGAHPGRRFRLRRGELEGGLPGFETVVHRELGGRAGLWARAREDGAG